MRSHINYQLGGCIGECNRSKARDGFPVAFSSFFSFLNDVLKAFEVLSEAGIGTGLTGVAREEGGWHRCISDEGPLPLTVHP